MSGPTKSVALVLLASCLCDSVTALDYVAPKLICVLGPAEALVRTGYCENIIDDFEIEIQEVIRGEGLRASDSIRISGEGKWYTETPLASVAGCDGAILFLMREAESDSWRIMGPLGAGRMLVRDGFAYLAGFRTEIPRQQYRPDEQALQRLPLATLLQAERDVGACLKWKKDKNAARARLVCTMAEFQGLKAHSELHRLLVDEVMTDLDSDLDCQW